MINLSLPFHRSDDSEVLASRDKRALLKLGHQGTHIDRLLKSEIPLDYFKCRGLLFDVRQTAQPGLVMTSDVDTSLVQSGDFVILRSGVIEKYAYGSQEYMTAAFELSWEFIEDLLSRQIRFIGIDSRSIRHDVNHRETDVHCEQAGTYIIENLCNLNKLKAMIPFNVYAAWFDFGGTGIPVRVIAEVPS